MKKALNICLCVDRWPTFYPLHGPARYAQTLARGLVARGQTVHVLTPHPEVHRDFEEDGYLVHSRAVAPLRFASRLQRGLGESLGLWKALRALRRTHPIDIVEFTNWEGLGAATCTLGRLPTVIRLHTTAYDTLRLGLGNRRLEAHYARLERWTARRATALVTHSESHRRQVAADYGVDADAVRVIPHGIEPVRVPDGVARDPNQILAVGAATPRKGVDVFLAAAERVSREVPQARFVWVGTDTATAPGGETWSRHCAKAFPHLHNVTFAGNCSDAELAAHYGRSAVYLCTSQYESFGLTLVEAMQAGLAVVAPNTASMSELVRQGQTGELYGPGDVGDLTRALAGLLRSPERTAGQGKHGAVRAGAEYSAEVMTERVLELYRNVC